MRIDPRALIRAQWRAGLGVEQLAERSGISPTHISRIRHGWERGSPGTVGKLAAALGVEPAELVVEDEDPAEIVS